MDFDEAQSVFLDDLSRMTVDRFHEEVEDRWIILGMSNRGRRLVVVFTERAETIRLISARLASRHERSVYADENL